MNDLKSQLRTGEDALNRGEFVRALASFTTLTRIAPQSIGAWCGRAAACYGIGELQNALAAAKQAVRLAPDDSRGFLVLAPPAFALGDRTGIEACRVHIARLPRGDGEILANFWSERLAEKDHFSLAAAAFSLFASRHMDEKLTALEMAHLHLNAFELEKGDRILDDIEARFGASAPTYTMRARISVIRGDSETAKAAALKAIEMNSAAVPAYVVLSDLAPDLIDSEKKIRLSEIVVDESFSPDMRVGANRVLGRVREKAGDYDGAFNAFAAAKLLSKELATASGLEYDEKAAETKVRMTVARYPETHVQRSKLCAAPLKLFIIGMPRSGSTLIDQILSRHSKAVSVGESLIIPRIENLVERKFREQTHDYRACTAELVAQYRNSYERAANGAACVADKNLFNFARCGLIADLDPDARFILALREPADIALSIFKTKFLAALPWSNDLRGIAHMQASFEFLTDHWRRILGDRILVVRHEHLVADFEAGVRKTLDFCELEFEPECLAFHEGKRRVFTVSAAQVRRPLNADGVGRWRRYEQHLKEFDRALEESRQRYAAHS
jgi:tetratricopeptide (TPR) repeat protein